MPSSQTSLFVNRLYVTRKNSAVYDEAFHHGVNIIRGENSSGKSTIADLIFYGLGGNLTQWKPEAKACDYVFLEVSINDSFLILKREITNSSQQPMSIYWGKLDDSLQSNISGWQSFPFRRSEKKQSFSQILFEALGFPEVRNDADSNITMHQILRLLYLDQLSHVQSLLRDEPFDSPLTRETIGDLLLGTYDDSIYLSRFELREAEKKIEDIKYQMKHLVSILEEADQETEPALIDETISEKEEQLEKIYTALKEYDAAGEISEALDKKIADEINEHRANYLEKQGLLNKLRDRLLELSIEIQDSKQFIHTLEARVKAFEEASITRDSFNSIKMSYCPVCLSPLGEHEDKTVCHLCKNPISLNTQKSHLLRMKQELLFQIRESKALLLEKEEDYSIIERKMPLLAEELNIAKLALEAELSKIQTKRNKDVDNLFLKRGQLESDLNALHKQRKAIIVLEDLKRSQSELGTKISQLKISIDNKINKQKERRGKALSRIEEISFELLQADLPREEVFQSPEKLIIDFRKNTFAVNGRNDFSASSIVYLKNCVHFAIAFASLDLDFFRYPRLILCDNMEDKGMEEERSHNFQRKIVELSNKYSLSHQIIFTTSMIAPELDSTLYCIGDKYTQLNKSLKLS
jgi:hypothetical protein